MKTSMLFRKEKGEQISLGISYRTQQKYMPNDNYREFQRSRLIQLKKSWQHLRGNSIYMPTTLSSYIETNEQLTAQHSIVVHLRTSICQKSLPIYFGCKRNQTTQVGVQQLIEYNKYIIKLKLIEAIKNSSKKQSSFTVNVQVPCGYPLAHNQHQTETIANPHLVEVLFVLNSIHQAAQLNSKWQL